ncbi:MotA/TolQ/ExbB proton channel family protein [Reinekea thalattae]|uniref:MotA/TolQ/ExbB proton channel family protein n=1 Tax=Reinekea thalattae TaxID=2593301 RepID=A0A5C8Z5F3_9GAMM|nr:MotA/TolQ/ExbB proton channel family protein [Reinekea thalattae]TXR52136.1 MotA/TolQ/ExbB proton channel family protein [Reinekea thalattae]
MSLSLNFLSVAGLQDGLFMVSQFMNKGGPVLWCLALVVFATWLLVAERILFLKWGFPEKQQQWLAAWQARQDQSSWYATAQRNAWLGEAYLLLNQHLNLIKLLIAICPLLGLLGTVTGMISVFDLMASQGNSEPRLMASGISLATLPTMAGMVCALTGLFVHAQIAKACLQRERQLEKLLRSQ